LFFSLWTICTYVLLCTYWLCYFYYCCCCTVCTALLFSYSAIFVAASVRNKLIHSRCKMDNKLIILTPEWMLVPKSRHIGPSNVVNHDKLVRFNELWYLHEPLYWRFWGNRYESVQVQCRHHIAATLVRCTAGYRPTHWCAVRLVPTMPLTTEPHLWVTLLVWLSSKNVIIIATFENDLMRPGPSISRSCNCVGAARWLAGPASAGRRAVGTA